MPGSSRLRTVCAAVSLGLGLGLQRGLPERSPFTQRLGLGAVALLEFLVAAARARIVAADVLEGIAHRLLRSMIAVRAMHVTVVVLMVMVVIVVAVRTVHVRLLGHRGSSVIEIGRNYLTLGLE